MVTLGCLFCRGCERSDITKHVLIHDDPRHVCEVCGKAFRHIKNKELHVKRHKGQRDYKCGVCDSYGYTFTDIRKHIERKHSDAKNILCDKCGAAFKNDVLLKVGIHYYSFHIICHLLSWASGGVANSYTPCPLHGRLI